jgi:hypothetical protein
MFAIDSITVPGLLFVIDSLIVTNLLFTANSLTVADRLCVIDSLPFADLPFIIDSLTVAAPRFRLVCFRYGRFSFNSRDASILPRRRGFAFGNFYAIAMI